jgi:hypothetical protein
MGVIPDNSVVVEDDLSAYEADGREAVQRDAGNILAQITNLVRELRDARADVATAEAVLKKHADRVRVLEQVAIPTAMREAQQERLRTSDGWDVELTETVRASIPADRLSEALAWLVAHDHASLIKRQLTLAFGREPGEAERARHLLDLILPEGYVPDDRQSVHAGTLTAAVKEMLANGVEVPRDLLGVFIQPMVKVKEAKRR